MRYSEIMRAHGHPEQSLKALLSSGQLIRELPFYKLPDQTIPKEMFPSAVVYIPPSSNELVKIKMAEREAMRKELEKLRLNLIDIKHFLNVAIEMLTPEEYKDEKEKKA